MVSGPTSGAVGCLLSPDSDGFSDAGILYG